MKFIRNLYQLPGVRERGRFEGLFICEALHFSQKPGICEGAIKVNEATQ